MDVPQPAVIENSIFDEIAIGKGASIVRDLTLDDVALFVVVSDEFNPSHVDPGHAATDAFHGVVAQGR